MPDLRLGVSRRGPDGRTHEKQAEYLAVDRSGDGISFTDLVMGRGGGKTIAGVRMAGDAAISLMPGIPGAWTEPTHGHLNRVFLPAWRDVWGAWEGVGWTYHASQRKIEFGNGSTIYLLSRNVDNPSRRIEGIGLTLGWMIHDEAAIKFDARQFASFLQAVRHPKATHKFVDTVTTPVLGPYKDYTLGEGHTVIHGSSRDNPWVSEETVKAWEDELDPEFRLSEIEGQFVSLSGRIFSGWVDKPWPEGNIYTDRPMQPGYSLFCDIGLTSSWLIVKHPPDGRGGFLDVVVGEWHPDRTGWSDEITKQIDAIYGAPSAVYVGSDVGTDGINVRDSAAATIISNRWGDMLHVQSPSGDLASKSLQLAAIKRAVISGAGRRLCLWDGCINHTTGDARKVRSFRRMIDEDAFPDSGDRSQTIWPKGPGHPHEHCRDALAYGTICKHPPQYGRNLYV